jgi:hypothetical protein
VSTCRLQPCLIYIYNTKNSAALDKNRLDHSHHRCHDFSTDTNRSALRTQRAVLAGLGHDHVAVFLREEHMERPVQETVKAGLPLGFLLLVYVAASFLVEVLIRHVCRAAEVHEDHGSMLGPQSECTLGASASIQSLVPGACPYSNPRSCRPSWRRSGCRYTPDARTIEIALHWKWHFKCIPEVPRVNLPAQAAAAGWA